MAQSGVAKVAIGTVAAFLVLGLASSASADLIEGTDSGEFLEGTNGRDTIWAMGGPDHVNAKDGNDTLHLGSGGDEGNGQHDNDNILGGESGVCCVHNDVLNGGPGRDDLEDNVGNDSETGCGDSGDDRIDVSDGDGQDFARGGDGSDTILADGGDDVLQAGSCA
jgi:Ca2+-binding RTX toxin-like protein